MIARVPLRTIADVTDYLESETEIYCHDGKVEFDKTPKEFTILGLVNPPDVYRWHTCVEYRGRDIDVTVEFHQHGWDENGPIVEVFYDAVIPLPYVDLPDELPKARLLRHLNEIHELGGR